MGAATISSSLRLLKPYDERRGIKSSVNDLVEDRGFVITRAVFSLRFVET